MSCLSDRDDHLECPFLRLVWRATVRAIGHWSRFVSSDRGFRHFRADLALATRSELGGSIHWNEPIRVAWRPSGSRVHAATVIARESRAAGLFIQRLACSRAVRQRALFYSLDQHDQTIA